VRKSVEKQMVYGNSRRRFPANTASETQVVVRGSRTPGVSAAFDGGKITSDGGGLLLREVEQRFGIVRSFVAAFTDHRSEDASEFTAAKMPANSP